jgi:hypothetical protein
LRGPHGAAWPWPFLAFAVLTVACTGHGSSPSATPAVAEPRWEDAFDPIPQLMLTLRPRSLQKDPVYGPLLRGVLALARARSRFVAATHALDAVEDADLVMVGLEAPPGQAIEQGDLIGAVVGVRSDIDPGALVDADGRRLWAPGPAGGVRELVRERVEGEELTEASLFELPGRTWVIASGIARSRARDAFARPRPRPSSLPAPPDAIALLRIDGPSLVARVPLLRAPSNLAPVGSKLKAVTLDLVPGETGQLEANVSYADGAARALAERTMREVLGAMARKAPEGLAWLAGATLERGSDAVTLILRAPLPPELMSTLQALTKRSVPPPKPL